jgi:capsular polysaccharide biosynthesis protein
MSDRNGRAYVYYDRERDVFESDTVLYIAGGTDTDSTLSGLPIALGTDRNVQNQARLLKTTDVARNVARRLNFGGDPSALLKSVNSSFESGQDFLTISATSRDRRRAADIANAFAAAFLELRRAQTRSAVQRALKVAREQLARLGPSAQNATQRTTLQQTVSRLEAAASTATGSVRQLDPAAAPETPASPKPRRSALFALAIALTLGVGLAYFLDRLDRRLRTIDAIKDAYGVPLVSVIPHAESATPVNAGGPFLDPAFRESFRGLHTNVRLLRA